jgi:GT2 family glycosyltransferase
MDSVVRLGRDVPDDPRVSIIVLFLDDVEMVESCLESLRRSIDSSWRAEFVVVANGTPLSRLQAMQRHEDIVLVRSGTNLGFAGGNNLAADVARGELLIFLNDDAEVEPDWLDQLVATAESDPCIGVVGSRILFEDGSLQEAGGIIWGDGPTTGVGRGLPAGTTEYMYVRDVDYVSANGILVRRRAWEDVGGFAEDYYPAYYEDVDLCMAMRRAGWRVVYEPRAVIRHFESRSTPGRYRWFLMLRNREIFRRKWADDLVGFEPYPLIGWDAAIHRALHRLRGRPSRVLILDDALPDPGLGSGFARARAAVEELADAGFAVTIRPRNFVLGDLRHTPARTGVLDWLADRGVDVRFEPLGPLLKRRGGEFDVILCSRPLNYKELMPHLRHFQPLLPLVYDTEALWYRRTEREADQVDDPIRAGELRRLVDEFRTTELDAVTSADHVVSVSSEEADIIAGLRAAGVGVSIIGGERVGSALGAEGWGERTGVLFPAGWLAGPLSPNLVSLQYFVDAVLPHLVEQIPWIRVLVTGGDPPDEALALAGPNVQFLGYVPDLAPLLGSVRAVAVPMLTGAGRKFKTLEAMLAGVPTVSTTVGAEGIDTDDTGGLIVTDDPEGFAQALLSLHEDPVIWMDERSRVEDFCASYDAQPQRGWATLLNTVIHDARLRSAPESYHQWLLATQPRPAQLAEQRIESTGWSYRPLISICVPVYEPKAGWLEAAVASVSAQTYDRLELCLVDDGSTDPAVGALLDRLAAEEPRVRVARRSDNGGISAATNDALTLAAGEFVAFLDQDDLLAPQALHRVVSHLQDHPDTDLYYCDEDLLDGNGRRRDPYLKPGWSPETLLSFNYITHFVVARRSLVELVGGLRPQFDGSQDHDLLLRLTERTDAVCHLDDVLYTWRQSPTSTSLASAAKPAAHDATVGAVSDALRRRGIAGHVERGRFGGGVMIHPTPTGPLPRVTLIVTAGGGIESMADAVRRLRPAVGGSVDVVVAVAAGACTSEQLGEFAGPDCRVVEVAGTPSRAALVNAAAAASGAEFLVTIDADVFVEATGWVDVLLGLCSLPGVGAAGVQIEGLDGRPRHEGIAIGAFGAAPITTGRADFVGIRLGPLLASMRDVSAVSGLCAMVKREVWDKVGGWDESAPDAAVDVDLCLRLGDAGYRVVHTPDVTVRLHRPFPDVVIPPTSSDPYFSRNLAPGSGTWGMEALKGGMGVG